jgi:hypothetical protein
VVGSTGSVLADVDNGSYVAGDGLARRGAS